MFREASASWQCGEFGNVLHIATQSQEFQVSRTTNLQDPSPGSGITPQELLASAHASCVAMSVAVQLKALGMNVQVLEVSCFISYHGNMIAGSHLSVKAKIEGIDSRQLEYILKDAERCSLISNVLGISVTFHTEVMA